LASTLRQQISHQTAGIGFWANKNGQALIESLNGGTTATDLGTWLAATFPDLYAANAGMHNLDGKTNTDVAQFFEKLKGQKLDGEVLATALSVYVTNSTLAGMTAEACGLQVSDFGLGSAAINIGNDGAAVGLPNNTVMTVMDILQATDQLSAGSDGVLYGGAAKLRSLASNLYSAIN
jgi:hypothetical protein